jgi:hypothetical protein
VVVQNATLHDLCMAPSETFPTAFRVYSSWTVPYNFIVKTSPRILIWSPTHHDRLDRAQRAATNLSSANCRCLSAHVDHLHATCGGALPGTRATIDQRPKKPGGMDLRTLRLGIQLRLTAVPRIQRFWSGHCIRAKTPVRDRCHHPSSRSQP